MTDTWTAKDDMVMNGTGLVAVVFDGQPAYSKPVDKSETARRAALLAAAPELYHALDMLLIAMQGGGSSPEVWDMALDSAESMARAALARARGDV